MPNNWLLNRKKTGSKLKKCKLHRKKCSGSKKNDGVGGQKRGLCLVRPLPHHNSLGLPGLFYHGAKESEINCVRMLLEDRNLANKRVTFDALHTQHDSLEMEANDQGLIKPKEK